MRKVGGAEAGTCSSPDGISSRSDEPARHKRAVLLLILRPYLVATEYMIADIFTKATDRGTYFKFRNVIMNMNGGLRANLERSLSAVHGAAARAVTRLMDCL